MSMTEHQFMSFKEIARLSQPGLRKLLITILKKTYPKGQVFCNSKYVYAIGDIPIGLVAHMDTVHHEKPKFIFKDESANVVWSPQGLGADDRAGVFMILNIISMGLRPHIIFTADEEKGGIGATILSKRPNPFADLRYLIELDRSGYDDCVFYDCNNEEFTKYVMSFGFNPEFGTYSDIYDLCPEWGVAGVNLSVGYFKEHTLGEYLRTDVMYETLNKVKLMLTQEDIPYFEYISFYETDSEMPYGSYWDNSPLGGKVVCNKCGREFHELEVVPVLRNKETIWYCPDCLYGNVNWCSSCGEAFETSNMKHNALCDKCKERISKDG